ncbi:hypothetical protein JCM8202_004530 [Rhodotorula sphaerocarpa]
MPIGPQLPPHLAQQREAAGAAKSDAPAEPVAAGPSRPPAPEVDDDDDDDDDFGPALPPDLAAERQSSSKDAFSSAAAVAGPSRPVVSGPQLPPHLAARRRSPSPPRRQAGPVFGPSRPDAGPQQYGGFGADPDDDDGVDVGPLPLPAGYTYDAVDDGAQQIREREERERKRQQDALEDKKPKREEWMLVPPKEMDLLSSMDSTKLKSRGFATGKAAQSAASGSGSDGVNLWTETPAERQQRLKDEMLGKKRKAENAPADEETDDERRKRLRDLQLREEVDKHNKTKRSESLLDKHVKSGKKGDKGEADDRAPTAIWDRDRDMSIGGRLMDDSQRTSAVKNAKGLGGRFGGGSFL